MLVKIRKASDVRPSEITSQSAYMKRRQFLKAGVSAFAGLGLARAGISEAAIQQGPGRLEKIPGIRETDYRPQEAITEYEHITTYNNFYEFGTGKSDPHRNAGTLRTRPWTVVVDGECEAPGEIGIEEILSGFTQEERIYRFRCVEAWSMVIPWVGVPLADLLKRFKPTSDARYVAFETLHDTEQMPGQKLPVLEWPYREGLRIDEAMHPLTLMATGLYGEVLPNQNGAPLRLVVPWKYGFKSIKSIVSPMQPGTCRTRVSTVSTPTSIPMSITRAGARSLTGSSARASLPARRRRNSSTGMARRLRVSMPGWIFEKSSEPGNGVSATAHPLVKAGPFPGLPAAAVPARAARGQ